MSKNWLASLDWLRANLENPQVVILDIRTPEQNDEAHIPNSLFMPEFYDTFVDTSERGLAAFQQQVTSWVRRATITADHTVVCYENTTGMRCTRAAWMLAYAGHPNVRVLDGGFTAWLAAGLPTSNTEFARMPSEFSPTFDESLIATRTQTREAVERSEAVIVDCRERAEFLGTDDFTCCPRRGRIPNSVFFYWREALTEDDAHFVDGATLRARLESHGITSDKEVIIYCHRGARAANTWMALQRLGYPRVKNYIGSWHEWSASSELPLERG